MKPYKTTVFLAVVPPLAIAAYLTVAYQWDRTMALAFAAGCIGNLFAVTLADAFRRSLEATTTVHRDYTRLAEVLEARNEAPRR